MATIKGTSKADKLSSKVPGTDIHGYGGDDVLVGLAGGIRLYGGDGRDELTTKFASKNPAKASFLYGGNGNDVITAAIWSPSGIVRADLYGGDGNDTITVNANAALQEEGTGSDDTPGAEAVRVLVSGGAGNDQIQAHAQGWGWSVDDANADLVIDAGSGNDVVTGGAYSGEGYAKSVVWGRTGDDILDIVTSARVGSHTQADAEIYGGDGNDTITSEINAGASLGPDGTSAIGTGLIDGGRGNDKISVTVGTRRTDTVDLTVIGGSGDDVISARIQSDVPITNYWAAKLYGGKGDDTITATVESMSTSAYIHAYGGDGNDRIEVEGGGANILYGGSGADTIIGGRGDDTIIGGPGGDDLYGGFGKDTFVFFKEVDVTNMIHDFEGDDIIDLSNIDANTKVAGRQAFTWKGEFGKIGSLNYVTHEDEGNFLIAKTGSYTMYIHFEDGWALNFTEESFIL